MVAIVRFSSLVGLASAIALQSGGQVPSKKRSGGVSGNKLNGSDKIPDEVGSDEVDEARDKLEKESHKIYFKKVVQDPQGKMLESGSLESGREAAGRKESGGQVPGKKMNGSDEIPDETGSDEAWKKLQEEFEKRGKADVFEDPQGEMVEVIETPLSGCSFRYQRQGFWEATWLFFPEVTDAMQTSTKPSFSIRYGSDGWATVNYMTNISHLAEGPSQAIEDMFRDVNPFAHLKDTIKNHLSPKPRCASLFHAIMSHPPPGGYAKGSEGFRMFMEDKHEKGIQKIKVWNERKIGFRKAPKGK
ncbi:hypothetical protein FOZ63_000590 [Perkinsus olseni]|uniref:Uncharacterized protein n=1 Tax=Perkinsus olseni TaxID=32597 RepID=A0A7J6TH30_PEROL|nr:hypothetical protein FOZ62_009551 [Perkinsus olseni]KAF4757557.1 hypothetical protein FOZ63_000590 [Perkinsus olseni]